LKKIISEKPCQFHTTLTYAQWTYRKTTKNSIGHTPFQLLYGQEVFMLIDLELSSLKHGIQGKELNSIDNPQRFNALLAFEYKKCYSLTNLNKRQQSIKKYFDKKAKTTTFGVGQKVFLWDFANANKGKHSTFYKLWLGPYLVGFVFGSNYYLLKDEKGRIFSYKKCK
jgi:hypothetical protein